MTTEHSERGRNEVDRGRLFRTVLHGYDKRQVEDYVAELRDRVSALEARLESARRDAARERDDRVTRQTPSGSGHEHSGHEQVSRRMMQILQLAEEEAWQRREEASRHAAAILGKAQAEARELLEAAHSTAEELLRTAMRRSQAERDEPAPVPPDADRRQGRRARQAASRAGAPLGPA
jgi:cell division septum initiation protein DivIVA